MNTYFLRTTAGILMLFGGLLFILSITAGIVYWAALPPNAPDTTIWLVIVSTAAAMLPGIFVCALAQLIGIVVQMLEALVQIEINTRN